MTIQQAYEIIKAQAKLLIHLTERVVRLQVAFEAYGNPYRRCVVGEGPSQKPKRQVTMG